MKKKIKKPTTSNEELQSANEKLTTINDELTVRNTEINHLSNDLTNLISSVEIPIVMIGPLGKIRPYRTAENKIYD